MNTLLNKSQATCDTCDTCVTRDTIYFMTATSHAIIGTIIAAKIGNPYIAIPLAFISHIAADFFPHWDTATNSKTKTKKKVLFDSFIDVFASLAATILLVTKLFPETDLLYAFFIAFISQLPDWLMAPYYFFHIKLFKPFYNFQKIFDRRLNKPWGIINQVAILLLLILLAKIL